MASSEVPSVRSAPVNPLWRAGAYLCILFAIVSTVMYARTAFLQPAAYGGVASASLGGTLVRTSDDGRIDVIVRNLRPGTPLADAGVREGDRLRLDIPWNDFRTLGTGESFGFTRVAPGPPHHIAFRVPEFAGHSKDVSNVRFLITLFDLALGLLLFVRCRGDVGVEALGLAFVAATISSNFPAPPGWSIFWITIAYLGVAVVPFLMLAFALSFYGRNSAPVRPVEKRGFWLLCGLLGLSFLIGFYSNFRAYSSPLIRLNVAALAIEITLAYAGTVYYFLRGYRLARGDLRKRYAFLLIALLLTFCLTLVQTFSFLVLKRAKMNPDNPLYDVNVVLSLLGPLLFAYTVLRHRVVDLGFVLNRTLVYGAVSLVMLAAFGLSEWAVDEFVKPEGHNANAVLDAAIAVGVFLTFHRVRDFVEHHLEALFFRRWHDNEQRLRRFVTEAGFIGRTDRLIHAFLQELRRFTDEARTAIYLDAGGGSYKAAHDVEAMPAAIDADDPVPVAMRAHRQHVDPAETASELEATLALPMLHRNALIGFVLLGPKQDGQDYRPDEIEALASATRQIGLDLHALEIERLEEQSRTLAERVALLERENAGLRRSAAIA